MLLVFTKEIKPAIHVDPRLLSTKGHRAESGMGQGQGPDFCQKLADQVALRLQRSLGQKQFVMITRQFFPLGIT
jgi:hypothetical protein